MYLGDVYMYIRQEVVYRKGPLSAKSGYWQNRSRDMQMFTAQEIT